MEHLTLEERYKISVLLELETPKKEIAAQLGRNRSTIYRELKRNADNRSGNYNAGLAQRKVKKRHKDKAKREVFTASMKKFVCEGLKCHLSPKQIKGRANLENIPCVSHERILPIRMAG